MNLEEYQDFLDNHGIKWKPSGVSLALEVCPECGSREWKVRLRVQGTDPSQPFLGRCQHGKCEKGYSSVSYLIKMGVPVDEVLALHGQDANASFGSLTPKNDDILSLKIEQPVEIVDKSKYEEKLQQDIKNFIDISVWPTHPAAIYAQKRGVSKEHYNIVKIDPTSNCVVFLVKDNNNNIIGYQKRYAGLPFPGTPKALTSEGFDKGRHLYCIPREGCDILICEGPFTAVSGWHYGYYSVCTFGSSVSESQIGQIVELAKKRNVNIGIAYEPDDAGIKSFDRLRKVLYWMDFNLYKVIPDIKVKENEDLNDIWIRKGTVHRDCDVNWSGPAIPDLGNFL